MSSEKSLGVVITGSTRGVGRAMAEQFLRNNDRVVVTSRTEDAVRSTVNALKRQFPSANVYGCVTDVRNHADVSRLADFASDNLGTVNTFICNAGVVGSTRAPVRDTTSEDLRKVVETNLLGPLFCAKEGIRVSDQQGQPLHMFMMDGSGTRGNATNGYAAYGATKRAIPQLVKTLVKEVGDGNIRFHPLSPGMVLTDLLLGGSPEPKSRMIFNILADEPETVAAEIVPQIRDAVIADKRSTYIQYLTISKAMYRLSTGFLLGFRKNLFFDNETGKRIDRGGRYSETGVRLRD